MIGRKTLSDSEKYLILSFQQGKCWDCDKEFSYKFQDEYRDVYTNYDVWKLPRPLGDGRFVHLMTGEIIEQEKIKVETKVYLLSEINFHHVIPLSEGGNNNLIENIIALCIPCHYKRHKRSLNDDNPTN